MNCVIPFYQGDVKATIRLLKWIQQLEGCNGHNCFLIADAATDWNDCCDIKELAEKVFSHVSIIATDDAIHGWPNGPNELFRTAALAMAEVGDSWLWLEPDAVPLRPHWLDMIEAEYRACGKPYLGAVMTGDHGFKQLAGVAVYPHDAIKDMGDAIREGEAFDMTTADKTLPKTAPSKRIQHFWGQEGFSPMFVEEAGRESPVNTFTLDKLHQSAVLFHRSKDGTLIRLLWRRMYPDSAPEADILLVIPFWNGDAPATITLLKWIAELNPKMTHDVLLTYDNSTINTWVAETEALARRCFRNVYQLKRPTPPSTSWPQGPNFSFQTTATHIFHVHRRPWLWMEPDAIPIKPNWLDVISREYELCGMPFFGPVVKTYGHMNGVAVYPWDFPQRCPETMKAKDHAFDSAMAREMMNDCCDSGEIMQHLWGIDKGQPSETHGASPTFTSKENLKWILPTAVMMHRCKDGSLIKLLREERR